MNCAAVALIELCSLGVLILVQVPVSQGQDYSMSSLGLETAQTGGTMRGHGLSYTVLSLCPPEQGAGGPFIPWHYSLGGNNKAFF